MMYLPKLLPLWGLIIFFVSVLTGCTAPDADSSQVITIDSVPARAYVEVEYVQSTCLTPCTIRLDTRQRITISKEGFETQQFYLSPNDRKIIRVELELIAASQSVEENSLPDIP